MPKFLKRQLRAEYGTDDRAVYGTLNKIGAMHGNKVTAKGKAMERAHAERQHAKKSKRR